MPEPECRIAPGFARDPGQLCSGLQPIAHGIIPVDEMISRRDHIKANVLDPLELAEHFIPVPTWQGNNLNFNASDMTTLPSDDLLAEGDNHGAEFVG